MVNCTILILRDVKRVRNLHFFPIEKTGRGTGKPNFLWQQKHEKRLEVIIMNSLNLNWYELPTENNIDNLVSFLLSVFLAFPIFHSFQQLVVKC